jgi:hypothetical protein
LEANAVSRWTYSDKQRAKITWPGPEENPYAPLPKMHLLAYEMPEKLREVALNNFSEFSLTEFVRTERVDDTPRFIHEQEVQKCSIHPRTRSAEVAGPVTRTGYSESLGERRQPGASSVAIRGRQSS